MSEIRVAYTKSYANNYDDIFRKPVKAKTCGCADGTRCYVCAPETFCTHREKFCQVHQGGCEVHSYLMGDGKCSCQPCFPKPSTNP